jgi:hypothetical protein
MCDPHIVIERDGDAYTVRVEPAGVGDHFAARYPTHKAALPYARMTGRLRGWRVEDRTGGAS